MLHYLLSPFIRDFPTLRLINYISVRAAAAAVTALLLTFLVGPPIIPRLRAMRDHRSSDSKPIFAGVGGGIR